MTRTPLQALTLALLTLTGWTGAAEANWEFIGGEGEAEHVARVCNTGNEVICFELGCATGEPLAFRLSTQNMPEMVAAPRLDTLLFIGSQLAGSLEFRQSGLESFRAPLEETHLRGIERLKAGIRAQLHVWYGADSAPEIHRFTLIGSRVAISAAEAQCALPDFSARELERRTVADPSSQILGDMREACTVLNGALTVGENFEQPFDIDGQPPMDLRINHGAMLCDSTPELVCGTAGCLTSFWIGLDDGRYRRVFMNAMQDAEQTEVPGELRLTFRGSRCGGDDQRCAQTYAFEANELVPQGAPEPLPAPEEDVEAPSAAD